MKILLDENPPFPAVALLRCVLVGHEVLHVDEVKWKRKEDKYLIPDAKRSGFDVLVTRDHGQLNDPDECKILRKTGIHHVRYRQRDGLAELARSVAALLAAMPDIIAELEQVTSQRLVEVTALSARSQRQTSIDPQTAPPHYWKGRRRRSKP